MTCENHCSLSQLQHEVLPRPEHAGPADALHESLLSPVFEVREAPGTSGGSEPPAPRLPGNQPTPPDPGRRQGSVGDMVPILKRGAGRPSTPFVSRAAPRAQSGNARTIPEQLPSRAAVAGKACLLGPCCEAASDCRPATAGSPGPVAGRTNAAA